MPINGAEWIDTQHYIQAMEYDTEVKVSDSNNLYLTAKSQKPLLCWAKKATGEMICIVPFVSSLNICKTKLYIVFGCTHM